MITIAHPTDLTWNVVEAVAFDHQSLRIDENLLAQVEAGRQKFLDLIAKGVPCYGVTTGLGDFVTASLSEIEQQDLSANILRARAAAIGPPLAKPIVRALMLLRLVNFLSGLDGVSSQLCQFLVARLNDDFTPWVPSLGHGMAADAIAHTHAFQTFIGEGFVLTDNGEKQPAAQALQARSVSPYSLAEKEGLALINGLAASPAYAFNAHRHLSQVLAMANAVAAVSLEAVAAPKDSVDPALKLANETPAVLEIIKTLEPYLRNSQIRPHKLQSAISFRIIPQVHGAFFEALTRLRQAIETNFIRFSDNPLLVPDDSAMGGRFLSVGLFHDQQLLNQIEQVALALGHVGALVERRLHRLLNPTQTGLSPQLAARPGLDAGLVVTQKACIGLVARLKSLAQPVSLFTAESSAGQEDYMALMFPAISRLYDMVDLVYALLAYELYASLIALQQRSAQPGDGVTAIATYFEERIDPLTKDRSPGPDVEIVLQAFSSAEFLALLKQINHSNVISRKDAETLRKIKN